VAQRSASADPATALVIPTDERGHIRIQDMSPICLAFSIVYNRQHEKSDSTLRFTFPSAFPKKILFCSGLIAVFLHFNIDTAAAGRTYELVIPASVFPF
jgi:hypothetical protein